MPLHLLGKKSWNVYNQDNVARVRRDEATAQAREEEEERRMQEVDAERRIQLLRGRDVTTLTPTEDRPEDSLVKHDGRPSRKRKRRHGEDDTDRDIRYAKEDALLLLSGQDNAASSRRPTSDAPLTDHHGHISLFPQERARSHVAKNPEAEAEAAKKKREYEDQYTMRFSNAAGFKQSLSDPWYASLGGKREPSEQQDGKERWGNDGHRRQERQEAKKHDDDPLASMRRGVQEMKKVEKEKLAWMEEREHELRQMKRTERDDRREASKQRRYERELDAFWLDPPAELLQTRSRKHDRHDRDAGRQKHYHHHERDGGRISRSRSQRTRQEAHEREQGYQRHK